MIILGLTGSVAMGKSTAAVMLQRKSLPVHDSDAAVRHIYRHDKEFAEQLKVFFPEALTGLRQKADRTKISKIIYEDPDKKRLLESLLHPKVRESQQAFLKKCRRLHQDIAVLDIPLLYETGAETRCDYVMVVTAPYHVQRARVLARPGMTEEKFHDILNAQMPDAEKHARADFIVHTGLGRARMLQDIEGVLRSLNTVAS